jgi:hypothetical protein
MLFCFEIVRMDGTMSSVEGDLDTAEAVKITMFRDSMKNGLQGRLRGRIGVAIEGSLATTFSRALLAILTPHSREL